MNKPTRFALIPAFIPLVFAVVAMNPVEILGCRLHGLIAISIALAGSLLALATVTKGLFDRINKKPGSGCRIISTLILTLPALYIVLFET